MNPDYNQPTSLIQCGKNRREPTTMQTTGELIKHLETFPRGTVLLKRLDDGGFIEANIVVKATGEHRNAVEVSV